MIPACTLNYYSIAPRIPPGWGQRINAKSVALAVEIIVIVSVAIVALLGCWVEKLLRAAFAWLRRFAVVAFRIVGDVCVAGWRLRPVGIQGGCQPDFQRFLGGFTCDFWEIFE